MNSTVQNDSGSWPADDALLKLQLQVAQRADRLAQTRSGEPDPDYDLKCWLEAEREVFSRGECTTA